MKYELIIIGGGPAGCAAAVYAARKQLKTLLILNEWGGQSIVSDDIQNWIGTNHISGSDLAKNLKAHVEEYGANIVDIVEGELVTNISGALGDFIVKVNEGINLSEINLSKSDNVENREYHTSAVLIATGSSRRKLEAIGADIFEHKGVTYCASCDGPTYSGAAVAVIGGGNAAFESAAQLLAYCPTVYILNRTDSYRADEITVNKLKLNPNLKIINNVIVKEIHGDKFVNALTYISTTTDDDSSLLDISEKNKKGSSLSSTLDKKEIKLDVEGVFVEIGQIPATSFAKDICVLDAIGKIKIDARTQQTMTKGIWAAGDCTDILYHQNNIAAGDAVRALEDIYVHLKTK